MINSRQVSLRGSSPATATTSISKATMDNLIYSSYNFTAHRNDQASWPMICIYFMCIGILPRILRNTERFNHRYVVNLQPRTWWENDSLKLKKLITIAFGYEKTVNGKPICFSKGKCCTETFPSVHSKILEMELDPNYFFPLEELCWLLQKPNDLHKMLLLKDTRSQEMRSAAGRKNQWKLPASRSSSRRICLESKTLAVKKLYFPPTAFTKEGEKNLFIVMIILNITKTLSSLV